MLSSPPPSPDEITIIQSSVGNWSPVFAVIAFVLGAIWWLVRTTRKVVTQEDFDEAMNVERARTKALEAWKETTSLTVAETAATVRMVSDQVKDVGARVDRGFEGIQRRLDDLFKAGSDRDRRSS
jgi:hypothetical protein